MDFDDNPDINDRFNIKELTSENYGNTQKNIKLKKNVFFVFNVFKIFYRDKNVKDHCITTDPKLISKFLNYVSTKISAYLQNICGSNLVFVQLSTCSKALFLAANIFIYYKKKHVSDKNFPTYWDPCTKHKCI